MAYLKHQTVRLYLIWKLWTTVFEKRALCPSSGFGRGWTFWSPQDCHKTVRNLSCQGHRCCSLQASDRAHHDCRQDTQHGLRFQGLLTSIFFSALFTRWKSSLYCLKYKNEQCNWSRAVSVTSSSVKSRVSCNGSYPQFSPCLHFWLVSIITTAAGRKDSFSPYAANTEILKELAQWRKPFRVNLAIYFHKEKTTKQKAQ